MKKLFILLLVPIFGFAQEYYFDAFVSATEKKSNQFKLINTQDNNIDVFSHSDATLSLYDLNKQLLHTFSYKVIDGTFKTNYLKSYKLHDEIISSIFEIEKIDANTYQIVEYRNEKRKKVLFKMICTIEDTTLNYSNSLYADIGSEKRTIILNLLRNQIGESKNFIIKKQSSFYGNNNVHTREITSFGENKIKIVVPNKLVF